MNRTPFRAAGLLLMGGMFLVLLPAPVRAQTASSYDEATKRYQNRTREAELGYLLDLKVALKAAMARGDLDGARKVDAVRAQVEKDLKDRGWRELPEVPDTAKGPVPTPAAPAVTEEFVARSVTGYWILENGKGVLLAPMQLVAGARGQVDLTCVKGTPYTVCGTYEVQPGKLVKVRRPDDAYWDLTWCFGDGKWVLRGSQYNGWTLKRPPP